MISLTPPPTVTHPFVVTAVNVEVMFHEHRAKSELRREYV
jgi:hypothetical protein